MMKRSTKACCKVHIKSNFSQNKSKNRSKLSMKTITILNYCSIAKLRRNYNTKQYMVKISKIEKYQRIE